MNGQPTRRAVLLGGSLLGLGLLVPLPALHAQSAPTVFLTPDELSTLRAVVDRVVPADLDPGALEAGVAEAIDALLGALTREPPLLFAGAPFSDRGGAPRNDFATPLQLDEYELMSLRLLLEGSRGQAGLEQAGPVKGLQTVYREGLAALDEAAAPARFADLPGPLRDAALRTDDPRVVALVDIAVPQVFEFFYGPPEYGGNRDLLSWSFTYYEGDTLPRGYTDAEVETLSPRSNQPLPLPTGVPLSELAAAAAFATHEAVSGAQAVGGLAALRSRVGTAVDGATTSAEQS